MSENIKNGLEELFDDAIELSRQFGKKTYAQSFQKAYEKYRGLFSEIMVLCNSSEDKESVLMELADVLPERLEQKIEGVSKRKREAVLIDYNMAMVAYVIPLITYNHDTDCDMLADFIIEQWNQHTENTRISKSSYEQIQNGFKNRLCYITTAVCQSLDKPDDCYELNLLRNYRDEYLLAQKNGEEIVKEYYNVAPTIVKKIGQSGREKEIYLGVWERYLKPCIEFIEQDQKEACREVYSDMVHDLQKKYLYS